MSLDRRRWNQDGAEILVTDSTLGQFDALGARDLAGTEAELDYLGLRRQARCLDSNEPIRRRGFIE